MLVLGSNHLLGTRLVTNCYLNMGVLGSLPLGSFRKGFTLQTKQTPLANTFSRSSLRVLSNRAPKPLECKRQTLYEEEKPSKEFLEWAKLPDEKRSDKPPPLAS